MNVLALTVWRGLGNDGTHGLLAIAKRIFKSFKAIFLFWCFRVKSFMAKKVCFCSPGIMIGNLIALKQNGWLYFLVLYPHASTPCPTCVPWEKGTLRTDRDTDSMLLGQQPRPSKMTAVYGYHHSGMAAPHLPGHRARSEFSVCEVWVTQLVHWIEN